MRPHRQSSSRRDSRRSRNAEEEEEDSGRSGRRHVDFDRRHYPSASSPSSMSRPPPPPPTRGYHSHSDSRETRNYRADDMNMHDYGSRHQNRRGGEQSWQRGGSGGRESGGVSGPGAYRDYDRRRNYASANWDQRDYGNNAYNDYNNRRYDESHYTPNYGHRTPYSRNGGYSQSAYYSAGGYRSSNNSNQDSRRDIHGDRRRSYHSSTSRSAPSANNEARSGGGGGGGPPASDSTLRGQLFQHRETLTRFDPGRNIRTNKTIPRSSLPSSYPPKPAARPMKEPGPTEAYVKISLEKSERVGRADEDVDLDVNVENLVRKLLVLDLNGTLVYRSPHKRWHERFQAPEEDVYAQFDPSQPRPIRTAYPRPYLTSFRDYLFHPSTKRWLDTMVWSSAQPHSVNDMVVRCFGDKKDELVAIWARDRLGLNQNDYGRKVQTTKDLNKPWDELNTTLSATTTREINHSAKTTLLLDDSPLKAHLQPYNHLCIKEYDLEMRKHDIGVRELDVARNKLAGVIAGTQGIEDVLKKKPKNEDITTVAVKEDEEDTTAPEHHPAASDTRKRKRKEKKENKKQERVEQQLKKLTDGSDNPVGVYDETLLAVIGILDAVKRESNVAAWIRGGGLIRSLIKGAGDGGGGGDGGHHEKIGESSDGSRSSVTPIEAGKSPRKKVKFSREGLTLALPRTPSPITAESDTESETERTGVPLEDVPNEEGLEGGGGGAKNVEEQLWFNHSGTMAYWALRGRKVLEGMGIDVVVGVVGPTG